MMQYHVVTHFFQSTDMWNEASAVSVFVLRCKNKHDKQRSAMSGATDLVFYTLNVRDRPLIFEREEGWPIYIKKKNIHHTSAYTFTALSKIRPLQPRNLKHKTHRSFWTRPGIMTMTSSFSKCYSPCKTQTGFQFFWLKELFRKAVFSWRISLDGRPNRRKKAAFSNFSGVVWMDIIN